MKQRNQADQKLEESLKITQRAEALRDSTATPYFTFADDIKFDDARLMVAKGDGKGLCSWFNGLGHKFGAWLHKAEYFAKTFWKKTPDELDWSCRGHEEQLLQQSWRIHRKRNESPDFEPDKRNPKNQRRSFSG